MKAKTIIAAVLALGLAAAPVIATSGGFSDVGRHELGADIRYAVEQGWFQGYPDDTFRPDQRITQKQIATVISRAFPDGSTRAEMSSFMRGGFDRVNAPNPVSFTTDKPDRHEHTFGYAFVLAQMWITDAHDTDLISIEVKNEDGLTLFRMREEWYSNAQEDERYRHALWSVNPDYEYIVEVSGLGADDEVGYQFSQILHTFRYS